MFFKKYFLDIVLFITVIIVTLMVRYEFLAKPNKINIFIVGFMVLLYLSCIYEISIKIGKTRGSPISKIFKEVIIVWIIPLIIGWFI